MRRLTLPLVAWLLILTTTATPESASFIRGHTRSASRLDIGDAIVLLSWLFSTGREPRCADAADANDDGSLNVSDAIYVLRYLFSSGPPPSPPFPNCGEDPSVDALDCAESLPVCL